MRTFILAGAVALALASCGRSPQAEAPTFPTEGEQKVDMSIHEDLPQWVQIARQSDGGFIYWDRTSIVRYPGEEATVWVQVRYGEPQLFESEDATTRTAVRYELERVHYRFKCAEEAFTVLERRFIGNEERVLGTAVPDPIIYRPVVAGGAAGVVLPVACRGR